MAECLDKFPKYLKDPISVNGDWVSMIYLPCGKCARCYERRKMEWCFRMYEEMKVSKCSHFVTLTYDPMTVPYDKYGNKVLVKDHLQGFFKRLRINSQRNDDVHREHLYFGLRKSDKVKYYAAGEYGSLHKRPHFHAIIYNASAKHIENAWSIDGVSLGYVDIGNVTKESIAYVMKYLDKRLGKVDPDSWKKPKEFNVMSEGIGFDYLNRMGRWHKKNLDVVYVINETGFKVPMPRIYRERLFSEHERLVQLVIVNETLKELEAEKINDYGSLGYEALKYQNKQQSLLKFKRKTRVREFD